MRRQASEGVLQVATGPRHREEAIAAIGRIRPHLNGRPVSLVTDAPHLIPDGLFDQIIHHQQPVLGYRDKIPPLLRLPYPRTLFLDTDLELLRPIEDVFLILKSVDLVGCHAPVRWSQWQSPEVPEGFCELNSGVIGLRRGWRQRALVRRWLMLYDAVGVSFDQATLRAALWWAHSRCGLRSWVLPPEYNLRTPKPWLTGAGMAVKILHGRVPEDMRPDLRRYLNDNIDQFRSSTALPTEQNQLVVPYQPQSNP
jgi:hypothetical protein